MFSRRKSREPSYGPLPGNQSTNVNSNALAAASAIGHALKTGTPIPRTNSLQRTGSLQRSSFSNPKISRSSSLLGLQTKSGFQFDSRPNEQQQKQQPPRSQSLVTSAKPKTQKPRALKPSAKPRTIKKHVPGPYGLVTIEVPIEEEEERIKEAHRRSSFTKPERRFHSNDGGSIRSLNSNSSTKRNAHLKDVQEDFPLDFDSSTQPSAPYFSEKHHDLGSIVEDPLEEKEIVQSPKEADIKESQAPIEQIKNYEENIIPETVNTTEDAIIETPSSELYEDPLTEVPEVPEVVIIKKEVETIVSQVPVLDQTDLENKVATETGISSEVPVQEEIEHEIPVKPVQPVETLPVDNEESDEAPSTAKSTILSNEPQSSFTEEEDIEPQIYSYQGASMAQQLRPRIFVNNEPTLQNANDPIEKSSSQDINSTLSQRSSLYSEPSLKSEDDIPTRSAKRDNLKSALKNRSSTSVNIKENSNPASAAYLSLTTAENTRLNAALSNKKVTSNGFNGSANGARVEQNGFKKPGQPQAKKLNSVRPQSTQVTRSPSKSNPAAKRPQSQSYAKPPPTQNSIPQLNRSPSSVAAVNATLRKDAPKLPPPVLVKKSSFEKDRNSESHAAFKRLSLRDASVNQQYAQRLPESNLGFYRDQSKSQPKRAPIPPPAAPEPAPFVPSVGGYKSRFNDSDSDDELFSPPQKLNNVNPTLRKPRSQFTLRTASASTVPSPQKSLPEQRNTRFFSESHEPGAFASAGEEKPQKKKKSFGGKLKKLFGRSKD